MYQNIFEAYAFMVVNRDVKTGCQTLVAGRACEASFYAKAVLEWIKIKY